MFTFARLRNKTILLFSIILRNYIYNYILAITTYIKLNIKLNIKLI